MSAVDELRAEVERLRAESEDRRRYLLATLQRENEARRALADLRARIAALVRDLDAARADGTIYTYGQVQDRLRALLAGSGEQPGEDHEPDLSDGVPDDDGKALPAGLCYRCQRPSEAHRPAPVVPDSPDVRERVRGWLERNYGTSVGFTYPCETHDWLAAADDLLAVVRSGEQGGEG